MPELQRLLIGDNPRSWEAAGFTITGGETVIGNIAVRFVDARETDDKNRGVIGWELTGLPEVVADGAIDGIKTAATDSANSGSAKHPVAHRNRVSRMDHVVIMTPNIARTVSSLHDAGFSTRRTRDIPDTQPPRRQVFMWAGETILEVVGSVSGDGPEPATIWGLALTTDDIDAAAVELGAAMATPKEAVQPGRRISTINTKELGISIALALMTPHVPAEEALTANPLDA